MLEEEVKMLNSVLLEKFRSPDAAQQRQAADACKEFIECVQREALRETPAEVPFVIIEGIPVFASDFEGDTDGRMKFVDRVKVHLFNERREFGKGLVDHLG